MVKIMIARIFGEAVRCFLPAAFPAAVLVEPFAQQYTKLLIEDLSIIETAAILQNKPGERETISYGYSIRYSSLLTTWLNAIYYVVNTIRTEHPGRIDKMIGRLTAADRHRHNLEAWREQTLPAIVKTGKLAEDQLILAKCKLASAIHDHRLMLSANQVIRTGGPQVSDRLTEIGITPVVMLLLTAVDEEGNRKFKPFDLTDNRHYIRRLYKLVSELAAERARAASNNDFD